MEKLASITILTTNRQKVSSEINNLLTQNGSLIMARMGVNVQKNCSENCPGMILLSLKGEEEKIKGLFTELEKISETSVKICFFNETF
ncbi:MAG: hypothetical protein WC928_00430 [Patescibacteria group bacterium]|jgi:metal-responsive CopG/Arc/MetJ family transcriptional regulator